MDSNTQSNILTRSSPPSRAMDASSKPRPKLLAALRKPAPSSSEGESDSEDDTPASEDELSITATTTKLSTSSSSSPHMNPSSEGEHSDGEAARERMKRRLAASKNTSENQKGQEESHVAVTIESSEDEDVIPTRTNIRRLDARRPKSNSRPASPSPSARSRQSSPGLFVTPNASPAVKKQSKTLACAGSESDDSSHNADLQEKVKRIRAERLAEKGEEQQQSMRKKLARQRVDQASGSDTDGESGRRLTQQAKPTRKAGKKAMEAMARDQQRISRNMQLTHQAKTKKRYTTQDLCARFGFNGPSDQIHAAPSPNTASALTSSDAEVNQAQDTPPTSPPPEDEQAKKDATSAVDVPEQHRDQLPSAKIDKGKGRAPEFQHLPLQPWMEKAETVTVQNAQVPINKSTNDVMVELSDSDDEPQIAQPKSRFPVFDRLPTKKQHESASLLRLRSLAQLARSPQKGKKGERRTTLAEMERSLAQKARQQKNQQREERIAELRQRGHVIETEEEREKYQMEVEDMVAQFEKQRQEDLKLAKLEKDEAKKNGETIDDLPSSDESDGDYVGSGEENAIEEVEEEVEELELSGSEEEEMEEDEQTHDEDMAKDSNNLIDGMIDEDDEPEDVDMEDEDVSAHARKQTVNRARNRVIADDDESDDEPIDHILPIEQTSQVAAMAAFGFGDANPELGLTQMFAGTMANLESNSQSAPVHGEPEQDSLDFLRNLPETQPGANFTQEADFMVPNSQSLMSPRKESQIGPETQFSLGISQLIQTSPAFSRTQPEDFELTQDAGFSFSRSPAGLIPPQSTIDTVMMPILESPIKERKGKLQRGRREATVELSDADDDLLKAQDAESEDDIQQPPRPSDAFLKMQKAAKKQKAMDEFKKKISMAKEAVMEQAEESEDEYAGLGGASDDEEGEEDQELRDMIDHNDVKVDERQIAAFYADKSKKEDEKNIADLYKKIQTGGLRRQAGFRDGFDMSDSEDEAEQRQRRKQAEFQQMSRALLKDERVKKLADDPKKKPFLNTLADFPDEGDYNFLDMPADIGMANQDDSQSTPNQEDEVIPDSQTNPSSASFNPLKRKSPESQKENRPPPNLRRTAATDTLTRKPLTLADVQHSVSELLEDPHILVPESQYSDASDDDASAAPTRAARKPVVDRLSLSRASSATQHDGTLAFHAPAGGAAAPGFRVPSLIRRATSSFSAASDGGRSSGRNTPTESAVRRGGTGRSNIHAQAREAERRAALEKKEGKRKAALKRKVAGGRKGKSVLAGLGGGFEE